MRLALVNPSVHPDFLDLPWHLPLAEWESPRGVDLPQGLHRHQVRFLDYDGAVYVVKEMPPELVTREVRILRRLADMGVPAVEAVGSVLGRGERAGGEGVLITRHLTFSLSVRLLLMDGRMPHLQDRVLDAIAGMLVRNHLAGFFWGDCSLANILFRRDAGALTAYVVDVETGELHPGLSDGQRATDLEIAGENLAGGFLDLEAAGMLGSGADPLEMARSVESRYRDLWRLITEEEVFAAGETFRTEQRIVKINQMGFDVEEIELIDAADGAELRLIPRVVEVGFHAPALRRLTGLETQENQARRLLNDIARFRHELEVESGGAVPEGLAAVRWLDRVFEPTLARIPMDMRSKLEPAEIYHQILEHRWFLSEARGGDVGLDEATGSYVAAVLPHARDEDRIVDAETGFDA
ncbi:MAG: DUF4032 domain-containing protein [Actinobacteria bacterium]|nr:DUF4032 domain-containing protein [Actinomycetota bacterium]